MASIWDTLFPKTDYRTKARGGYADLYANGLLGSRTDTPRSVDAMRSSQDFVPVLGDVLAFGEAGNALAKGDRKTAAIMAGAGLLGLVPGVGDALARPVMAAGRKGAELARRIEVDPNAMGSMGGNVRLGAGDWAREGMSVPELIAASRKRLADRDAAVSSAAMTDAPLRMKTDGGMNALVSRSPDVEGGWRITYMGEDGVPNGHVDASDKSSAVRRAMEDGFNAPATLPTPRTDAEAMAKQVLEMRAAGNAGDVTDGIRAFHGSPHDFDKFSMDNLGTGEGAQVYGQGLYLAEAEGTAKMYRDTLSQQNASAAQRALTSSGGDVQEAISKAKEKILHYENLAAEPGAHKMAGRLLQINRQKLSDLETGASPAGKMYEVNIAANADDFLDYDLPLNQQPQRFAPDINAIADIQGIGKLDQFGDSASFKSFLDELEKKAGPTGARQEFTDAGIPGIKYLDADSRSAGKGTQNFVVFDDKLISIVRKYGIAGAATMLGVSALDVEQAMAQGSPPKGLLSQADQRQQRRGLLE